MRLAPLLPALLLLAPVLASPAVGSFHTTLGVTADREYVLVMRGTSFNGFEHPRTPLLEAFVGERVRFTVVVPAAVAEPHTFHLHGHPWLIPETGRMIDTILLRGGDVHSFFVTAGSVGLEPGDWMYHCHMDAHAAAGMWGIFRVYPFSVRASASGSTIEVSVHRLGEPLEARAIRVDLDGAPVAAHVAPGERGQYEVHAALPPAASGTLNVWAEVDGLGASVARVPLGAREPAPLALELPAAHGAH